MALQAKCDSCKVRFIWTGNLKLAEATCPVCRKPLKRTTRSSPLRTIALLHHKPKGLSFKGGIQEGKLGKYYWAYNDKRDCFEVVPVAVKGRRASWPRQRSR